MSNPIYAVYAIGNALVDSEYEVNDAQLQAMGVSKGHMTLIDADRRAELLSHVAQQQHGRRSGGGSAANTAVAVAQLGGSAFYSCRVADDELGMFYRNDLTANGVATNLSPTNAPSGQTGSCMVLVTPDAERSMCTFLGSTAQLDTSALRPDAIAKAKVYYMEGYLAASPSGLQAALLGRSIAQENGVALAATLSDMSMIQFCRTNLEAMVGSGDDGLDYLFCNEEEAKGWSGAEDEAGIFQALRKLSKVVCITRGAQGCWLIQDNEMMSIDTTPVKPVDTNGAGDMFAGAFLYAVTQGETLERAARLANLAAAQVVSQYGCRLTPDQMKEVYRRFSA